MTTKKKPATKKPTVGRKVFHPLPVFRTPKGRPSCVVCGRPIDFGETYRQHPLETDTWAHWEHIPKDER